MNPTPITSWAGGKSKLLPEIAARMPPAGEITRYVEPFIGGGAVFFALGRHLGELKAQLADVNADLIATYSLVRNSPQAVIDVLTAYAAQHSRVYYNNLRLEFNGSELTGVHRAAAMLYLNRACFNGLWRTSKAGKFNTPFGDRVEVKVDAPNLLAVSEALRDAQLTYADFESVIARCTDGDFIYVDPPYTPVSKTADFTAYSAGGFPLRDHARLQRALLAAGTRGAKYMVSAADTFHVDELYPDHTISRVSVARSVGASATTRVRAAEVIITNY